MGHQRCAGISVYLSPFVLFRVNPFRMNPSSFYGEGEIRGAVLL